MNLLPMPFTWQDYLDWVEENYPDVTYGHVCDTFEGAKRIGMVREGGVRDDGEILYEPGIVPGRILFLVKKDELVPFVDYKPERDE